MAENATFLKRSPEWQFLKTPFSSFRVDGEKRDFSKTITIKYWIQPSSCKSVIPDRHFPRILQPFFFSFFLSAVLTTFKWNFCFGKQLCIAKRRLCANPLTVFFSSNFTTVKLWVTRVRNVKKMGVTEFVAEIMWCSKVTLNLKDRASLLNMATVSVRQKIL